jgi:hypothetical protein
MHLVVNASEILGSPTFEGILAMSESSDRDTNVIPIETHYPDFSLRSSFT